MKTPLILLMALTAATAYAQEEPELGMAGDPLYDWCESVQDVLFRARERAREAYSTGRLDRAKRILIAGLAEAEQSSGIGRRARLFSAAAITRGKNLAMTLDARLAGSPSADATVARFLFRDYDFIEFVSRELDQRFHIPWRHCRRDCESRYDDLDYQHNYLRFAQEQVQMVLDGLAVERNGSIYPLGDPRAFLKALQITSAYSSRDLRSSVFATQYACPIRWLEGLSSRLRRYDQGDREEWEGEPQAVGGSYREAQDILSYLVHDYDCRRHDRGHGFP